MNAQIVRSSLLASEEDSREQSAAAGASAALPEKDKDAKLPAVPSSKSLQDSGELEGSIRNRAAAAVFLAPRFCLLDFR